MSACVCVFRSVPLCCVGCLLGNKQTEGTDEEAEHSSDRKMLPGRWSATHVERETKGTFSFSPALRPPIRASLKSLRKSVSSLCDGGVTLAKRFFIFSLFFTGRRFSFGVIGCDCAWRAAAWIGRLLLRLLLLLFLASSSSYPPPSSLLFFFSSSSFQPLLLLALLPFVLFFTSFLSLSSPSSFSSSSSYSSFMCNCVYTRSYVRSRMWRPSIRTPRSCLSSPRSRMARHA